MIEMNSGAQSQGIVQGLRCGVQQLRHSKVEVQLAVLLLLVAASLITSVSTIMDAFPVYIKSFRRAY